ncbi:MAG: DUF5688 family protein, partial [Eubacterium sp.]|nr:DUF5688 family protein [Eubacterium sp.]
IRKDILHGAGVTLKEIFEAALLNIDKCFEIMDMSSMLMAMDVINEPIDSDCKMLILSNKDKVLGAASMLSKKALSQIHKVFGEKFVILSSSIHEVIAVPYEEETVTNCNFLIREINATKVEPEEVLCNHAFICENCELSILD